MGLFDDIKRGAIGWGTGGLSEVYRAGKNWLNDGGGGGSLGIGSGPSYEDIIATIRSIGDLPKLRDTVMPEIQGLYGEGGPILAPHIRALREGTDQAISGAQSDMMKRGLTGSSIEAAGLGAARAGGLNAEADLRGGIAERLSDLLFKASAGDIEAATQLKTLLAQAMGEERALQMDLAMFDRNLRSDQKSSKMKALMGLGGSALNAGATAMKFSDQRLKTGIKTVNKVGPLRVVSFTWNKDAAKVGLKPGDKGVGVLGQDVEKHFPEVVGESMGFKTVDYKKLAQRLAEKPAKKPSKKEA